MTSRVRPLACVMCVRQVDTTHDQGVVSVRVGWPCGPGDGQRYCTVYITVYTQVYKYYTTAIRWTLQSTAIFIQASRDSELNWLKIQSPQSVKGYRVHFHNFHGRLTFDRSHIHTCMHTCMYVIHLGI